MSGHLAARFHDLDTTGGFRLGDARSVDDLRRGLSGAIVGQDEAVDAVVRALMIAGAGLADRRRPIASLLFVGPTGVGKTEMARRIAHLVRGDADNLCRIDMNSLAQEHYAASLSGAPPGYAGSKESFTLFERDKIEGTVSRPGVVLFDEIEKAHPTVLRALLQILDAGTLRIASGTSTIDFRNSIVLLTSNLGTREIHDLRRTRRWAPIGAASRVVDRIRHGRRDETAIAVDAVRDFLDPELFNRFDEIIAFRSIDTGTARRVVDLEVERLTDELATRGVLCTVTDDARTCLATTGFDERYGARHLHRTLRREIHAPIAERLLRRPAGPIPLLITVDVSEDVIVISDTEPSTESGAGDE
ncbi:AAA family ATPase [Gordonia sp. NPDC003422]